MRPLAVVTLVATSCTFVVPPVGVGGEETPDHGVVTSFDLAGRDLGERDLAQPGDAPPPPLDETLPPPDLAVGFVASHLPAHYVTDGTCDLVFTAAATIDTGKLTIDGHAPPAGCAMAAESEAGKVEVAVLAVRTLVIPVGITIRVRGPRGLAVVARATITIDGTLDGSAELGVPGPGGAGTGMGPGAGGGGHHDGSWRDSGGGGGGYGVAGDAGGEASFGSGKAQSGGGGPIYPKGDPELAVAVFGGSGGGRASAEKNGCPGQDQSGGGGGGSLQLSAAEFLRVSGVLRVAGGGGAGGCVKQDIANPVAGSGGGGGSGGALFLEAPAITTSGGAVLAANGGGGGGGADYVLNKPGGTGASGQASAQPAAGGTATGGAGGAGGDGGALASGPSEGTSISGHLDGNGGGGGGGYGRIVIRSHGAADLHGTISPDPTLVTNL